MFENRVYQFTDISLYTYLYLNYNIEPYKEWLDNKYPSLFNSTVTTKFINITNKNIYFEKDTDNDRMLNNFIVGKRFYRINLNNKHINIESLSTIPFIITLINDNII